MWRNEHFSVLPMSLVVFTICFSSLAFAKQDDSDKTLPPTGSMQMGLPLTGLTSQTQNIPLDKGSLPSPTTKVTTESIATKPLPPVQEPVLPTEDLPIDEEAQKVKPITKQKKVATEKAEKEKETPVSLPTTKQPSEVESDMHNWFTIVQQPISVKKEDKKIVVTSTRREGHTLADENRAVTVLTSKELERQGEYRLHESLRNVPGVRVRTLGPVGDNTTIFIRGTRSTDTAFFVNGLPFRDAADPQGSANGFISDLFVGKFEQVEVLRGTGSTLYGSEAIGGVIQLQMKQGRKGRPKSKVSYEGGSYNTHKQTYQVDGGTDWMDYFFHYSHITTDGIRVSDGYGSHDFAVNLGFQPIEGVEARFIVNANKGRQHLNDSPVMLPGGILVQDTSDPNNLRRSSFIHYIATLDHEFNEHFKHGVNFGFVDTDRRFSNGLDAVDTGSSDNQFDGNISNVEYVADIHVNENLNIKVGAEHEREELTQVTEGFSDFGFGFTVTTPITKAERSVYRFGGFGQIDLSFLEKALNFTAGGRITHHENAHTNQIGELSASYLLRKTNTRIKGHVGTGFRAPSLFELFGVSHFGTGVFSFGNPNLEPERTVSWDVGIEQKLFNEKVKMSATFFKTDYTRRIRFVGAGYTNVTGGHTQGAELEATLQPTDNFRITGSYTRTLGEFDASSVQVIPRNQFGIDIFFQPHKRVEMGVNVSHKGNDRTTIFGGPPLFGSTVVNNGSYTKVDARLAINLNDGSQIWVRADNLLGASFLESGFRNPGAQVYGGVSMEV